MAAAYALSLGLQFIKAPVNAVSQTHQKTSCHLTWPILDQNGPQNTVAAQVPKPIVEDIQATVCQSES